MIQDTKYKIQAKKSLGQNFLINPHIIDRIVSAGEITRDDTVLEIGPGTGNLTKKLLEKAGKVIAVEKDRRLIESLGQFKDLEVVEGDILEFDAKSYKLQETSYKIVANIPYYITSIFLKTIFENWPRPKLIVLTIQKEVAQRIIAKPPHMNLLALSVQYFSEPKIIATISKNNFRPVPKIDSSIIRLIPKEVENNPELFNLLRAGFSEKRKQLGSVLSKKLKIPKDKILESFRDIGLKEGIRAENLSLNQWAELNNYLNNLSTKL